jgi:outer membrane immunogenic protein
MKKVLLVTASLIALGAAAPAVAADLAARPYTKAPAMIAAVYDWSGFYIGANGGWGSSRSSWDFLPGVVTFGEGSHDASGGTVGGQVGYRWQAGTWVFGVEAQGNWADFKGSNISLFNATVRPGRLRRQQRPVLRQGRCGCDLERLPPVCRCNQHPVCCEQR